MNHTLTEIYSAVDDFYQQYEKTLMTALLPKTVSSKKTIKKSAMHPSEIMTIMIFFHLSQFRNFKSYYLNLKGFDSKAFPKLLSYNRFVELMPSVLLPLGMFLYSKKGKVTGISFIDSTVLRICNIKRASRNKVFRGLAQKSKSTMGWFMGFKLHLIVNDMGELLGFQLTPGNTDDRIPLQKLAQGLYGKLFGDKGYISQPIFEKLFAQGLQLITPIKKNMKNKLLPLIDKVLLRKRALIETVNDQLKNICQIEHTRHRSFFNFVGNLISGLIAYAFQPKKPQLNFSGINAIKNNLPTVVL